MKEYEKPIIIEEEIEIEDIVAASLNDETDYGKIENINDFFGGIF
ncbi:MAG: hypothetical protein ACI35S_06230 [Anaeroplasma sp.]